MTRASASTGTRSHSSSSTTSYSPALRADDAAATWFNGSSRVRQRDSHVRAHSSRFPARRTGGLGVVADELALVASQLHRRPTWPSPTARVLIDVAGGAPISPAFVCEGRVALGR